MSEITRGIEAMGRAAAVTLLLTLTLGSAAAKEPAATAAVVVEAPEQGDAAPGREWQKPEMQNRFLRAESNTPHKLALQTVNRRHN